MAKLHLISRLLLSLALAPVLFLVLIGIILLPLAYVILWLLPYEISFFFDACRKCSDFVGVLGKRFVGLGNSIVIFRRKDWKIYLAKSSMSVWRRSEQNASNGISLSAGILRIAYGSLRPNYRRCRCPLQSAKLVLRTESLLLGNDMH
jgi:hypothetical protein